MPPLYNRVVKRVDQTHLGSACLPHGLNGLAHLSQDSKPQAKKEEKKRFCKGGGEEPNPFAKSWSDPKAQPSKQAKGKPTNKGKAKVGGQPAAKSTNKGTKRCSSQPTS
ncbi:hypothetical protein PIB30_078028 [Stylosanthes scabra]|uniref:Uncharacterized protein n=1 Tax=Stylosanthes scabra TaxID=79078 RepID=A0ABU6WP06_9FABA|nr:hypothetical protein [Stylosanthes scabra]